MRGNYNVNKSCLMVVGRGEKESERELEESWCPHILPGMGAWFGTSILLASKASYLQMD